MLEVTNSNAEGAGLSSKEAWWAGYRAGKGLPADYPRESCVEITNQINAALRNMLSAVDRLMEDHPPTPNQLKVMRLNANRARAIVRRPA